MFELAVSMINQEKKILMAVLLYGNAFCDMHKEPCGRSEPGALLLQLAKLWKRILLCFL